MKSGLKVSEKFLTFSGLVQKVSTSIEVSNYKETYFKLDGV